MHVQGVSWKGSHGFYKMIKNHFHERKKKSSFNLTIDISEHF